MGYSSVFLIEAMQKISFEEDILPLKDKLFRVAFRITSERADAEDVVQDVLLKVWRTHTSWEDKNSVEAFCTVMARNLALDKIKEKGRNTQPIAEENFQQADEQGVENAFLNAEAESIIVKLIEKLPEKQRTILQLRDVEGKTYREIAELLQITEEQVKVNLFRARQRIKMQYLEIDNYGL